MAKRKRKKPEKKNKKTKKIVPSPVSKPVLSDSNDVTVSDIPVYDFFSDHDLNHDIDECIENLIFDFKSGYFFIWEAVVREEMGLPLSKRQEEALDELLGFSDDGGPILYIDETPRPKAPWYEIIRKVVPELIVDPFKTFEVYNEVYGTGWPAIVDCLENYASELTLPEGVSSPIEVISPEIRHKLWLQYCFDSLGGLGQDEDLTLEDEEQRLWRIEDFIDSLKEFRESVVFFDLTLERLIKLLIMRPKDEKILIETLQHELGIKSVSDKLGDVL